jgi:hypothetical protein
MEGDGPERAKGVPPTTVANDEATMGLVALRVPPQPAVVVLVLLLLLVVVVVEVLGVWISTGFLERFRPRWTWRSQYFWPATTSLEHLHFLPSVLRQRPGSGSMEPLPQYPDCNTDTTQHVHCSSSALNFLMQIAIAFEH